MGYTQKKRFTDKEIYQKSSYGSDVPIETYPPPLPHPETSRIDLTPPTSLTRDVIYGWPLIRIKDLEKPQRTTVALYYFISVNIFAFCCI